MANKWLWYVLGGAAIVFAVTNSANASGSGNISDQQLSQTANFEGFSATAYADGSDTSGNQLYSIGYGHQIQPNESYLLTATLTQAQALQMLQNDMARVIAVLSNSGISFTPGQFDALSDFGYNAGIPALNKVIAAFVSGGADAATNAMQQYIYWHPTPGGAAVVNQNLINRRNSEIVTFNS